METNEVLNKLEQTLFSEGVPEEERIKRAQILREAIENGQKMSDLIKAKKKKVYIRQPTVGLAQAIEMSFIAYFAGLMAGALAVVQSNQ